MIPLRGTSVSRGLARGEFSAGVTVDSKGGRSENLGRAAFTFAAVEGEVARGRGAGETGGETTYVPPVLAGSAGVGVSAAPAKDALPVTRMMKGFHFMAAEI